MICLPLVWAVLLFIVGLLAGHLWPSPVWLPLATIVLIITYFCRNRLHVPDILTVLFWCLLGAARISMPTDTPSLLSAAQERMRPQAERLIIRLEEAGVHDEPLALSAALLLGQKERLGRDVRQAYSLAGASHLLALSGMHLGILYGLFYFLLIRWVRFSSWRWHLLPPVLLAIWGYAVLAGLPLSLVRASVMLSVFTIGTLAERHQPPLHLLALSALLILMCSPHALFDISFQLSFLAVLFIILIFVPWRQFLIGIPGQWLWEMLGVSLAAWLGTAPLATYYFHQLPLTGFLLSPLLIPLTTVIIYLGLLTLLLPAFFPFVWLLSRAVALQSWIIRQWGAFDCLVVHDLYPSLLAVFLIYILFLIAALRTKWSIEQV